MLIIQRFWMPQSKEISFPVPVEHDSCTKQSSTLGQLTENPLVSWANPKKIDRSRGVQDSIVNDVEPEKALLANVLLPMALDANKMAIDAHVIEVYQPVS